MPLIPLDDLVMARNFRNLRTVGAAFLLETAQRILIFI